ncbi:MAG: ion transporter [Candidatus Lernaella stagnicola]|nr:ion transporter [Candidatus Lernaella stagnicola]
MQKRIYEIVEKASPEDRVSRAFDVAILALIVLNVLAVIAETIDEVQSSIGPALRAFEVFSVVVFSTEYLLRLWSCTLSPQYRHPVWGRVRYAFSFFMIIDFLAIAPFYFGMIGDLRFLRSLRLLRFFRIMKTLRYSTAAHTLVSVAKSKKEDLTISFVFSGVLFILASSAMYFCERDAQPEAFASIPHAMWWAAATLTTVGYGDVAPITVVGKVLGGIIAILGVTTFALPTAILGAGFLEKASSRNAAICPHCGATIQDDDLK